MKKVYLHKVATNNTPLNIHGMKPLHVACSIEVKPEDPAQLEKCKEVLKAIEEAGEVDINARDNVRN